MDKILIDGMNTLGLSLDGEALLRFKKYYSALEEKNKVMNLTSITGEADAARLHFLDCCAILKAADFNDKAVIDIGSGAGFPGLPLKIACPSINLTMLDSRGKRVDFLKEVCQLLDFNDTNCISTRAEEAPKDMYGGFDIAVSRAVARLNVLCELSLPFVSKGGVFIAMKGPEPSEELEEASNAISTLGGSRPEIISYNIPDTDIFHTAVVIHKISETPKAYPRRFAKIQKNPL